MSKDTVNNYKISIIVCCYNKDKTLQRTIDSLLNQTMFKDLELIFVNDCSTDNTGKILNSLVEQYNKNNNIKIINCNKNNGLFVARKIGIQNATAKYVGFCDADDYVDKGYYEELYNSLFDKLTNVHNIVNNSDIDIIQTSSVKFINGDNEISCNVNKTYTSYREGTFDIINDNDKLDVMINWVMGPSVWNRLYKYSVISKLLNTEDNYINYMEDHITTIIPLIYSNKYKAIETKNFYHYDITDNDDHMCNNDNIYNNENNMIKVYNIIDNYVKNNNLQKYNELLLRYRYYYMFSKNMSILKNIKEQAVHNNIDKNILRKNDIVKHVSNNIIQSAIGYRSLTNNNDKYLPVINKILNHVQY